MKRIAIALLLVLHVSLCSASDATIPGAIRWDAWHSDLGSYTNASVTRSLGPDRWHFRAPWFAVPQGKDSILINGNRQEVIDAEIRYAHQAGLKFWAYLWYGEGDPMMNAWHLHQSSKIRDEMNWVQMNKLGALGGPIQFRSQFSSIIEYMKQPNYQKIQDGRPLWMVYVANISDLQTYWGGSWENFKSALGTFRKAVQDASLANPYIVLVYPSAEASHAGGFDAFSNYVPSFGKPSVAEPWQVASEAINHYWEQNAAAARADHVGFIPIAGLGFDDRPRQENPVDWQKKERLLHPASGFFVQKPTAQQIVDHLQRAANFVRSNADIASSNVVLIYSWDECDESPAPIVPTYTPTGPDTTVVDALQKVNW